MSTYTGVAPATSIMLTVEAQVIGVVITSSPGFRPSAIRPMCCPAVAEESARTWGNPVYAAKSFSNRSALGPVVIQPDLRESTTSSISTCRIVGRENGRKSGRLTNEPVIAMSPPGERPGVANARGARRSWRCRGRSQPPETQSQHGVMIARSAETGDRGPGSGYRVRNGRGPGTEEAWSVVVVQWHGGGAFADVRASLPFRSPGPGPRSPGSP